MSKKLTRFEKGLIMYLFFGILAIDLFQYGIFHFLSPFQSTDLLYLYKIPWIDDLPNYGYILSLAPAFIGMVIAIVGIFARKVTVRLPVVSTGLLVAMLISMTFLPISIPLVLGYLVLIASVGVNVIFGSPDFAGGEKLSMENMSYNSKTREVVLECYRLAHNRWSTMVRELIGYVLSVALIAASVIFAYLSSGMSALSEIAISPVFFEVQTIFIGIILLYSLFGIFGGAFLFCYNQLLATEESLQGYLEKMIKKTAK